nr:hypothetical protein [Neisseria iguanae]
MYHFTGIGLIVALGLFFEVFFGGLFNFSQTFHAILGWFEKVVGGEKHLPQALKPRKYIKVIAIVFIIFLFKNYLKDIGRNDI